MTARRRALLAAVVVAVTLVAATMLTGPPHDEGTPLDPRGAGAEGLRGVVDLAEQMGHDVDRAIEIPDDTSIRLFLPRDRLGPRGRERLREWVEAGGHLVVADPRSTLHGLRATTGAATDLVGPTGRRAGCELAVLEEVGTVSHSAWTSYEVPDDGIGCFDGGAEDAWLVARRHGSGVIVALGSPAPLQNAALDRGDNAALAAALLFPTPGQPLAVLPPDPESQLALGGDAASGTPAAGVGDLLPDRLPQALLLLAVAALALVLAIGRRLGRPVEERLPPTVPTAELARSVGDLLQRAGSRHGAATRLRAGARAEVARALGAVGVEPTVLADQAQARLRLPSEVVQQALLDLPVADDDDLVAVARATAAVHQELTAAVTGSPGDRRE